MDTGERALHADRRPESHRRERRRHLRHGRVNLNAGSLIPDPG
jgi:hypothetical protein